jgi:prefoldin subunit 5
MNAQMKEFVSKEYVGQSTINYKLPKKTFFIRLVVTDENSKTGDYSAQVEFYKKLKQEFPDKKIGYFLAVSSNVYRLPNIKYSSVVSKIKAGAEISKSDPMFSECVVDEQFYKILEGSGKLVQQDVDSFPIENEQMDDTSIKPNPVKSSSSKKTIDADTETVHESSETIVPDFNVEKSDFSKKINKFYSDFEKVQKRFNSINTGFSSFQTALQNIKQCLMSNNCDVEQNIDFSKIDSFKEIVEDLNKNMKDIEASLKQLGLMREYLNDKIKKDQKPSI